MKLNKVIDNTKGIYEIKCTRDEALNLLELVKQDYPYAVMEGIGYKSEIFILHTYANWGEYVTQEMAVDGKTTTCINCGRCGEIREPSRNSSLGIASSPERCFFEEFWSEVDEAMEHHFMMNGNAYSFTKGEGGFYGRRFTIELEDGRVLEDVGLWHRGEVPESIKHLFVKGVSK